MTGGDQDRLDDSPTLSAAQARALVRLLEAAPQVRRRYQYFIWLQTHVHMLVPHVLAVCGSYQRHRRSMLFECFHSIVVPEALLNGFADGDSLLMSGLAQGWIEGGGRARILPLDATSIEELPADPMLLREAGLGHLLVHGVARPQRPSEIESLFVFGAPELDPGPAAAAHLELLVPQLHATYLRVQGVERELQQPAPAQAAAVAESRRAPITARERQVLQGVREGKSNQQIGEALGISALTVKNHIQKILRKLGATNRAQAVAMTMALGAAPLRPKSTARASTE